MVQSQSQSTVRTWLVRWLYLIAAGHFLVGIALSWIANAPEFEDYHRSVEQFFWPTGAPAQARAPQDIAISLQATMWSHVAIDALALSMLLPPLVWLWRNDKK